MDGSRLEEVLERTLDLLNADQLARVREIQELHPWDRQSIVRPPLPPDPRMVEAQEIRRRKETIKSLQEWFRSDPSTRGEPPRMALCRKKTSS